MPPKRSSICAPLRIPRPPAGARRSGLRFDLGVDPAPLVGRLRIQGATLEATEIFELARLLEVASEARSVVLSARERYPRLAAHASAIADLHELAREFRGKILPDGTLADDASVVLAVFVAIASASAGRSKNRWLASCAPITKTARCRRISSPSAMTASWCRW